MNGYLIYKASQIACFLFFLVPCFVLLFVLFVGAPGAGSRPQVEQISKSPGAKCILRELAPIEPEKCSKP